MKRVVTVLLVLIMMLCIVGCGLNGRVASKKDVEFLTVNDAWYHYDPITYENEKMSFNEDFSMYWGCECGEPVGDSDLYEFFDYDKDKSELRVYNTYDGDEKVLKVLNYSKEHLMLEIDGVIKEFIPYSNSYDLTYDKEYLKGYSSYVSTREVQGSDLVVGPADYDGDVEYPDNAFRTYKMSDDIEFYDYFFKYDGEASHTYNKLSLKEGLEAFESSSAFIWFNDNLEICKVMYYGSLVIME